MCLRSWQAVKSTLLSPWATKIFIASNLGQCHHAGLTVLDTTGNVDTIIWLDRYYSVAPSICYDPEDNTLFLFYHRDESEEGYAADELILVALDTSARILRSKVDTVPVLDITGSMKLWRDQLIIENGGDLLFYNKEFELTKTLSVVTHGFGGVDLLSSEQWLVAVKPVWIFPGDSDGLQVTDTIYVYEESKDTFLLLPIKSTTRPSGLIDSKLFLHDLDNVLRIFDLNTGDYTDSIKLAAGVISVSATFSDENSLYTLQTDISNRLSLQRHSASGSELLWRSTGREKLMNSVARKESIFILTSLALDDKGSYDDVVYPTTRNLPLSSAEMPPGPDIRLLDAELLTPLTEEECTMPDCYFDSSKPAVVSLTVQNVGDDTIRNFAYYHTAAGASFCYPGRRQVYIEATIPPGEKYSFEESVYYYGPVSHYSSYFFVACPNHRVERDTLGQCH